MHQPAGTQLALLIASQALTQPLGQELATAFYFAPTKSTEIAIS